VHRGGWPDADMLPPATLVSAPAGNDRPSLLTHDEQYTLMSMWATPFPVMFGGDIGSSDAFTIDILTNPEVLK